MIARTSYLLAVAAILTIAAPVRAQLLSPGPLGRAHNELEGLSHCTACHDVGKKVDGEPCQRCHKELSESLARGVGFHAQSKKEGKPCLSCHKEHRGENAALAEWGGAVEKFDHNRTGYRLVDKHQALACEKCHRPEMAGSKELKKRLIQRKLATYLGVPSRCAACHTDEHRGQFKEACDSCHTTRGFKPAEGFDHTKKYKLVGAHARATCLQCHPLVADATPAAGPVPPVQAAQYARYTGVNDKGCSSCHQDVHMGKFGSRCQSCHGTDSWTKTRISDKDLKFHAKTRFPLKGKHQEAACNHCHPVDPKGGIKTKGFAFAHCTDCHRDAHLGQLAKGPKGYVQCESCHDEEGFFPPRYDVERHTRARFPLEGAHRVTACNRCHVADPEGLATEFSVAAPKNEAPLRGNELVNFTRLVMPDKDLTRCESCHQDPHGGQFNRSSPSKACATCHRVERFTDLRFDHTRDTAFTLVGKHATLACQQCHTASGPDAPVQYRGAPKNCGGCHADVHQGQFIDANTGTTPCEHCHRNDSFKPSQFSHNNPAFTAFALTGKHAALTCTACHPKLKLNSTTEALWYRGVPNRCDGCHVNIHAQPSGSHR